MSSIVGYTQVLSHTINSFVSLVRAIKRDAGSNRNLLLSLFINLSRDDSNGRRRRWRHRRRFRKWISNWCCRWREKWEKARSWGGKDLISHLSHFRQVCPLFHISVSVGKIHETTGSVSIASYSFVVTLLILFVLSRFIIDLRSPIHSTFKINLVERFSKGELLWEEVRGWMFLDLKWSSRLRID